MSDPFELNNHNPLDPNSHQRQPVPIGQTSVLIDRLLAEGGYARVYEASKAGHGGGKVAVKRIIAQTELARDVNRELVLMKMLKHKNIIEYIDSCAKTLGGGSVEFLICMEYCPGQLVDIMNRRMDSRFTENEVLQIFSDISEAVAYLHYLQPPVIHRDIKVENVLFSSTSRLFKLCDFGSCTSKTYPYGYQYTQVEVNQVQEEIDKRTTVQYRAPEMCDLYRRWGLTEKSDIWALGVLLYKICYFSTPFDDSKMAILNGNYNVPAKPEYSSGIKQFIRNMLTANPRDRPNIYRVVETCYLMRQKPCPLSNIYPPEESIPASPTSVNGQGGFFASAAGIVPETVIANTEITPQIAPQRRGRQQLQKSSTENAPVTSGDSFFPMSQAMPAQTGLPTSSTLPILNSVAGNDIFSLFDNSSTTEAAIIAPGNLFVSQVPMQPSPQMILPRPSQQPRNTLNRPQHIPTFDRQPVPQNQGNKDPFAQLVGESFGKYETLKPVSKTTQSPSLFQIMNQVHDHKKE